MVSRFGGSCEVGVVLNVLEWVWSVVLNVVVGHYSVSFRRWEPWDFLPPP